MTCAESVESRPAVLDHRRAVVQTIGSSVEDNLDLLVPLHKAWHLPLRLEVFLIREDLLQRSPELVQIKQV